MKHRRGFSLFELLVSIAIVTILTLVVVNVFIGVNQFNRAEHSRILVGDQASRLFANLDTTLRQGKDILASATINSTLYTTGSTTMVLTLPSIVNGEPSAAAVDTVAVHFDSLNNQLISTINPDATSGRVAGTSVLMTGVSDVYFRYTTDDPTDSSAVTVVALSSATISAQLFIQPALLYATLRNH